MPLDFPQHVHEALKYRWLTEDHLLHIAAVLLQFRKADIRRHEPERARFEGIVSVQLHEESTAFSYVLRFLNNLMVGVRDEGQFGDAATATIATKTGVVRPDRAER